MKAMLFLFFLLSTFIAFGEEGSLVPWYKGSVEEAFKEAKKENKPLFIYWGAKWCPPCNQIKKTIFTSQSFLDKVAFFIPVYLDGDSKEAPIWGQKLKAQGYPTILIMSSSGKELARLINFVPLEQFVAMLDVALQDHKDKKESFVLDLLKKDPKAYSENEWTKLSTYSFEQDSSFMERKDHLALLKKLYFGRVGRDGKSYGQKLSFLDTILSDETAEKKKLTPTEQKTIYADLLKMLQTKELWQKNIDILYSTPPKSLFLFDALTKKEKTEYYTKAMTLLGQLQSDKTITSYTHLILWKALLNLEKGNNKDFKPSPKTQEKLSSFAKDLDQNLKDAGLRQSQISFLIYVLSEYGLTDEAKKMAIAESEKSTLGAAYFMSDVAEFEAKNKNSEEALKWHKKAWDKTTGSTSRFGWGISYISAILELAPQKSDLLVQETKAFFTESIADKDLHLFDNMRTKGRLSNFVKNLKKWGGKKEHSKAYATIKSNIQFQCQGLSDKVVQKKCLTLF